MKNGLVSIMMPAYNAEAFIHQAIESAIAQSYPHWELIIVDDGSTDHTTEIAGSFKDSRIKLIMQENGGEAVARNKALQHMTGEWIAFLDADDAFLPDHLSVAVSALQGHSDWDGVYTDGIHIDTQGKELPRLSSRRRGPFEGWLFDKLVWGSDVFGPPLCVMIRREKVISRDLRYDPRIVIGPDWDFFLRYSEHASFGYLDEITCKYRIHLTNISLRAKAQVKLDSLALCRKKAIQLDSFSKCPEETRSFVFYELLVNLLDGKPDEQETILHQRQFLELPPAERARLLRLVAGKSVASGTDLRYPRKWLALSQELQPRDLRSLALTLMLRLSPKITVAILRRKYANQNDDLLSPFSDLMSA